MSSLKDGKLQVVAIGPAEYPLWQEYVEQHPDATVYHLFAWRSIFEKGLGYRSWYLLAREGREGRVVGCLPLFLVPFPFSRRLVSVPFRDRGGILWSTPPAFDRLLTEAKRIAGEVKAKFLQLKTLNPYPPDLVERNGLAEKRYWINSKVDLQTLDLDSLWSKIGQKTRNMIRQAEQAQLSLEDLTFSDSGLALWYDLHLSTQKRLGLPPFPRKFFQHMLQELRQENAIRLFLVRKDDELLAATIILLHRETAIYGYSSSRSAAQWMRPNDFMLFNTFKWLIENDYSEFDLGSDAPGQAGLLFFKKKWLAKQRAIPTYTFGQAQSWVSDSSDERYAFLRQIISYLPQGLLSHIGSQATKYFG